MTKTNVCINPAKISKYAWNNGAITGPRKLKTPPAPNMLPIKLDRPCAAAYIKDIMILPHSILPNKRNDIEMIIVNLPNILIGNKIGIGSKKLKNQFLTPLYLNDAS